MNVIKPTVGRVVWFWPNGKYSGGQPYAATIAYVHNDRCVNIGYLDANGIPMRATSVFLAQDGEPEPGGWFCEWMPYQKGQAAKTEQLEKAFAEIQPAGI